MKQKKLIKNYIYNTSYQILVLLAPLVTTPYVSRVLGVTNIGIFQYTQSIATYFVLLGAVGTTIYGQREVAYLQDNVLERSKVFWEVESFRIVTSLIFTLLYFVLFTRQGVYKEIYRILGIEVVATAFDISWFFMGLENFKLTVLRNTIIKLTGVICVFLFVKKPEDLLIYTLCMSLPILIGNISLWFALRKYLVHCNYTLLELLSGIGKRVKPILVLFVPQIAMDVYLFLDKTMIGKLAYKIDEVGYYSQAQRIVKVVLTIVTSLGTVMLPTMANLFSKGDQEGIVKSIKIAFEFIYMLSFALMFGLCAIAPRFVPIFFGKGYDPVVLLMIIISPILVIIATSNVIGRQYLLPTNQQRTFTLSIISGAVVNFILNMLLIPLFNAVGASIATVIAELAVALVQMWYVRKQLPLVECIKPMIRYCIIGAIMMVVIRGVGNLLGNGIVPMLMLIVVGMVVYIFELIITNDPMFKKGIILIRQFKR